MAVVIRDARLSVEQFVGEPEYGYVNTTGSVTTLAFTIRYEAIIGGTERKISEFINFVEHISIEGTLVKSKGLALPVEPGGGGESQHIPREQTLLVEKKLIVNQLGPLGNIPVRCRIEIRTAFPIEAKESTNTITVVGKKSRFTVATGLAKRALAWSRDQIVGRWTPSVRSRDDREG